ncbi:AraC family transcriptional regulator [Paenibacillus sp. CF384]|uniref:AraC family transcriptional regulator n=1 Tax=Paenibacillus sp. CF384 TaxID=1884382 RepID=UPI00089D4847|nr:AraC family transcriptional regulator [Paenibacillus sp. CF384]SDW91141.1 AraC-type DNA-binding protein [Paenibacillus sp. CF384]
MDTPVTGSNESAAFIYYNLNELDKQCSIWPVRGGITETKRGYYVGPKRIESYSLHIVKEGLLRIEWDAGNHVTLSEGDIFCLFPMRTYTYYAIENEAPPKMSWIVIDGPRAAEMIELTGLKSDYPFLHGKWTKEAGLALQDLLRLMSGEEKENALVRSLDMQSLLYRLIAALCRTTPKIDTREPADWVEQSMSYIRQHALEGISVEQAARAAGLNRTYYSVAFAKKAGMPPSDYITQVRMDAAKRLLAETDASITEIAYTTGYSSLYAFTRTFKNRLCLSPTSYREAVRKGI